MSNTQYAVCHLQKGSGNDSGMACHIERRDAKGNTYTPENADAQRTHLNRELISFPDGVTSRTAAIQHRLDTAGLERKIGKNQVRAVRIILTGTHEQMMRIHDRGRLDKWTDANLRWLRDTFGEDNVVSCVLHLDEKTPHLHATIVPIVTTERKRREREGDAKYKAKSGPRLSVSDVMARAKLREYQDTYAEAMRPFGLERGIIGSTAYHKTQQQYNAETLRNQQARIASLEEDIERLTAEVIAKQAERDDAMENAKAVALSFIGGGKLTEARKSIKEKDAEIASLKQQINAERSQLAAMRQQYEEKIAQLRNGYQRDIDTAIARAKRAERQVAERDSTIQRQRERIDTLDRKANPERYRLTSGAELTHHFLSGEFNPSLHIWTRVDDTVHDTVKFNVDYSLVQSFRAGDITLHELVNAIFEPLEQINETQYNLLMSLLDTASGGPAHPHIGTGSGPDTSHQSPWDGRNRTQPRPRRR